MSKWRKLVKSRKVIFRKSQKLLTKQALSELHGGSLFRIFNSYSSNFNGGLRKRRTGFCLLRSPSPRGKQFLWFLKIDLLRLFISSLIEVNFSFFRCALRINLPNLCPNMIMLMLWILVSDTLKWCFFWRSVYLKRFIAKRVISIIINSRYLQLKVLKYTEYTFDHKFKNIPVNV